MTTFACATLPPDAPSAALPVVVGIAATTTRKGTPRLFHFFRLEINFCVHFLLPLTSEGSHNLHPSYSSYGPRSERICTSPEDETEIRLVPLRSKKAFLKFLIRRGQNLRLDAALKSTYDFIKYNNASVTQR